MIIQKSEISDPYKQDIINNFFIELKKQNIDKYFEEMQIETYNKNIIQLIGLLNSKEYWSNFTYFFKFDFKRKIITSCLYDNINNECKRSLQTPLKFSIKNIVKLIKLNLIRGILL